jgi:flagellar biosynthesis/type III secretory pathway M-ring protein FliF/YscJ
MSLVDLAALVSAFAALVAAVVALMTFRRAGTVQAGVGAVQTKVDDVHVLVNNRLDTALERIAQLGGALRAADVEVPPRPGPPEV